MGDELHRFSILNKVVNDEGELGGVRRLINDKEDFIGNSDSDDRVE